MNKYLLISVISSCVCACSAPMTSPGETIEVVVFERNECTQRYPELIKALSTDGNDFDYSHALEAGDWAESVANLQALGLAGGLLPFKSRSTSLLGFVDSGGGVAVEPRFVQVRAFSEGLAAVATLDQDASVLRWGFINQTGRVVIPFIYEEAFDFHEGLAGVKANARFGFIDVRGVVVIDLEFRAVGNFSEGLCSVLTMDGVYRYIDFAGRSVLDRTETGPFDSHPGDFRNGMAMADSRGKWGFINRSGHFLIEPSYDVVHAFNGTQAIVEESGLYYIVACDGSKVFSSEVPMFIAPDGALSMLE